LKTMSEAFVKADRGEEGFSGRTVEELQEETVRRESGEMRTREREEEASRRRRAKQGWVDE
jgi:hypothetical protein